MPLGNKPLPQSVLTQPSSVSPYGVGRPQWFKCYLILSEPRMSRIFIIEVARNMLFSCDQAALWMVQSVPPSVPPSVTPFWLCSHQRIIMKFSGVITSDRSDVHAKGQGQRSKVKVTEVTTELNRFRTVTPVWIHIWWWNDAYSLIMLTWPRLGVSGL